MRARHSLSYFIGNALVTLGHRRIENIKLSARNACEALAFTGSMTMVRLNL